MGIAKRGNRFPRSWVLVGIESASIPTVVEDLLDSGNGQEALRNPSPRWLHPGFERPGMLNQLD